MKCALLLAFVTIILIVVLRPLRPLKGTIGERRVASFLRRLPKEEYRVINDFLYSGNGRSAQIDHIVISVHGLFVIETKFYRGRIYGSENREYWTQVSHFRKYQLYNPVWQNKGHIRALEFLLRECGYRNIPCVSIVAFSRQSDLRTNAPQAIYWDEITRRIRQYESEVLTQSQAKGIYDLLIARNQAKNIKEWKRHLANVRHRKIERDVAVSNHICPQCGGALKLRHGEYGEFYGCSNYPHCRYTTPS